MAKKGNVRVAEEYHELFHGLKFTPKTPFTNPDIKPWRKLPDRDNCTWDVKLADGQSIRFHVKRYLNRSFIDPAQNEAEAYRILARQNIPTAKLVAWGKTDSARTFIIVRDLAGYEAADKLIESGFSFAPLIEPTAELAARLHTGSLHHRDFYLCHIFVKADDKIVDLKLIDVARVSRLVNPFTRRRWIVKDLSQFWYSTLSLPITDAQRDQWLEYYCELSNVDDVPKLKQAILSKSKSIAQHDARLKKKQPGRNISIPKD